MNISPEEREQVAQELKQFALFPREQLGFTGHITWAGGTAVTSQQAALLDRSASS